LKNSGNINTVLDTKQEKEDKKEWEKGDQSATLPSTPCDVVVAISGGDSITIALSQEHWLLSLVACQQVAQQLQASRHTRTKDGPKFSVFFQ